MNLAQVLLLELDHLAFDFPIFLGEAVRGVRGGVGAGRVDEGVALGEVAVGVFEVITHDFNIKIICGPSILNAVGPLEGIF